MASESVALPLSDAHHLHLSRSEPTELLFYWRSVWKRRWWIILFAVILAVLAAVGVLYVTPIFRATVTLMIEQNKANLVSIEEVYSGVSANREHYQTQAEMLKSPALAAKVIAKLKLAEHPEFDPRQRTGVSVGPFKLSADSPAAASWTPERVEAAVLAEFLRRTSIEPVRLTQLVKLSFDSADKELAAQVANTLAESYIETDVELRSRITQRAGDWLADQLSTLKANLEESERALQQYREAQGLLDTRGLAQSGASRQIEELTRALNEATQKRIEAQNNFGQTKGSKSLEALPVVLRAPFIDRLRQAENQAEANVAALANRYGPEHARMVQAVKELNQARENTRIAIQALLASQKKEYEAAASDERAIERTLGQAKNAVQNINRKEFQLEALEQDVTTNRQLYERFLSRYRETRAASETYSNVVARIVDPAVAPDRAYKPRKQQIVAIGFIIGLLMGVIGALLRERVDSTVKSGDEVESKLALPTVAVLPRLEGGNIEAAGRHYLEQPKSVFSEAIRTARTSILLSAVDERRKILLITSSLPSEGKSSFALNLALAHAQTKKTLLVEADLRRPSLVNQLGLDQGKPGLTDLLTGSATFAECVQRVQGSTLYVIPSGPSPENPLEVLSSEGFRTTIERLAEACEMVIIDSPPVHLVSDAVMLSTLATGVLFVVKADSTPYPLARRCIRVLQDAGAEVIGVALNQLDFTKADRYYGAYTGYSKEYGGYEAKPAQAS